MSLNGRSVVVTGAGGSIGSELCRQVVEVGARRLTTVSLTESALYRLEKKLAPMAREYGVELCPVLGSVLDTPLMLEVVKPLDVVIHAAAHKHVPICEANPCEAIENNVGGTHQMALAAVMAGASQFVLISTDKAVRPSSVMGATKRVAELIVRDFGGATDFLTVRFGNVLDSDGSVLPLWREQIARGGPLTITHPDCERYFMAIPDAVQLILGTIALERRMGTFVFDMGAPRRMGDIANELIAHELLTSGRDIQIHETGLRAGEKLTEELHFGGKLVTTANRKIYEVVGDTTPPLAVGDVPLLLALARERRKPQARRSLFELAGMPYDFGPPPAAMRAA